jgi:hypothetical protein
VGQVETQGLLEMLEMGGLVGLVVMVALGV